MKSAHCYMLYNRPAAMFIDGLINIVHQPHRLGYGGDHLLIVIQVIKAQDATHFLRYGWLRNEMKGACNPKNC